MTLNQPGPAVESSRTPTGRPDAWALVAAVGAALNAGVFFSWSTMVMPAVERLPPGAGVAAMQRFDATAPAPYLLVAGATAAACVVVAVRGLGRFGTARGRLMVGGGVLFGVSALLVTFGGNVPISYAIDQLDPLRVDGQEWRRLVDRWTVFNHLRTGGTAAAAILLALAASSGRAGPAARSIPPPRTDGRAR